MNVNWRQLECVIFKSIDAVLKLSGVLEGSSDWLGPPSAGSSANLRIRDATGHLEKLCELLIRSGLQNTDSWGKCQMSWVWLTAPLSCQKKSPEQKNSEGNGRSPLSQSGWLWRSPLLLISVEEETYRNQRMSWKKRPVMKISKLHCSLWVLGHLLRCWWQSSAEDFQLLKMFQTT